MRLEWISSNRVHEATSSSELVQYKLLDGRQAEEGRGGGGGVQRIYTYKNADPMKMKHFSPPSKQAA